MPFPSRLPFISLLRYAPHGKNAEAARSRTVCRALKNDSFVMAQDQAGEPQHFWVIERAARRLRMELSRHQFLQDAFGPASLLVPVPRSAPLKNANALWPAMSLCNALVAEGLGRERTPLLIRTKPVRKSASAQPGLRPSPEDHYASTAINPLSHFATINKIVLVDDVVTRGSTFLGMYRRLVETFPAITVFCFAAIRTVPGEDFAGMLEPVAGLIQFNDGELLRSP